MEPFVKDQSSFSVTNVMMGQRSQKPEERRTILILILGQKKIVWLFSCSVTLEQTAVAVINIHITSWDLWRELSCHQQVFGF